MDAEIQNKLYEKYPGLFARKDLDMSKTCMCWGITCSNGWVDIIDEMCAELQVLSEAAGKPIEFEQMKEKFGGLRAYVGAAVEGTNEIIDGYAGRSYETCEWCGCVGDVKQAPGGWVRFLCVDCCKVMAENGNYWNCEDDSLIKKINDEIKTRLYKNTNVERLLDGTDEH